MIIGVDFDNTLITYDNVFYTLAIEQKYVTPNASASKKSIRDQIRQSPNGEIKWQQLQALAYGPRITEASIFDGVTRFFALCKSLHITTHIISHKSETAQFSKEGENLREAAVNWMTQQGFFDKSKLGLTRDNIHFGSTRQDKIDHIVRLGCTHFIDDLVEVFQEETFPSSVQRILYSPSDAPIHLPGIITVQNWHQINEHLFGIQ